MRVYLCGPITNSPNYRGEFESAEIALMDMGHTVVNPAGLDAVISPSAGFRHEEYMDICRHLMDKCEAICLLHGWQDSEGAKMELKEWLARDMGRVMVR